MPDNTHEKDYIPRMTWWWLYVSADANGLFSIPDLG